MQNRLVLKRQQAEAAFADVTRDAVKEITLEGRPLNVGYGSKVRPQAGLNL